MSRLSLRLRLTLVFALAMAVVLGATGVFLYARTRETLDDQIEQNLRARSDDLAAIAGRPAAEITLGDSRLGEEDESFAQLLGPGLDVRASSGGIDEPLLTQEQFEAAARAPVFVDRGPVGGDDARLRLLAAPAGDLVTVVGAALDDRDDALASLRTQLLVGGPLALLLASIGGYLLAAAALRPVEAMRRRAEQISTTNTGRLPVPAADDEIARLARTLNQMLERLEAGIARERRFVAEASHELRTPLALLKTELELALRRPRSADELRAALTSAAEETDRLAVLAEELLVLARADEGELRLDREQIDAGELLDAVARRFAPRAEEGARALRVEAPDDLVVEADRLLVEQALGNLVDNALLHGGGGVTLSAARRGDAVEFCVVDGGVGFAEDMLSRAFERFSGTVGRGGAGLGLALVDAIAQAHGGTVAARNRAGGGAEVVVALPA
jgi:two-component system, OmpR family, sensor kinase